MEYESNPLTGASKYVMKPKPQKIEERKYDPIRERFNQMRDIARAQRQTRGASRFFDRSAQNDDALIFYRQAQFMKDFKDNYEDTSPVSHYFPYYQMLGYEQLRTYFTWRTKVRMRNITNTSLGYAFLYLYEIIVNVGVADPQDGLDKLMYFWIEFRKYNKAISRYVLQWLMDYHIYYDLPYTFKEFVEKNELAVFYPKLVGEEDSFDLFCSISKYNIVKSTFYTDETGGMISDCFVFVLDKIRKSFEAGGMNFDDVMFRPTRKLVNWKPFQDALFYDHIKYKFRQVVMTENDIYVCKNGEWFKGTILTTEKGKQFIGYVMKQMEASLRKITKYRVKLTANLDMIHEDTIRILNKAGIYIEKIVPEAVMEYYREATKTVVTVDHAALARIREEALETQEALIVEEEAEKNFRMPKTESKPTLYAKYESIFDDDPAAETEKEHYLGEGTKSEPASEHMIESARTNESAKANTLAGVNEPTQENDRTHESENTYEPQNTPTFAPVPDLDIWETLRNTLTDTELNALSVILQNGDIKAYADSRGEMLEVLVEGINDKAMDYIGDNLMDDDFVIYDEYIEQVKEWIK
jgi:hypothetical protein